MKTSIVMITGAGSGFGFLLAARLKDSHTIIAVVRKKSDVEKLEALGIIHIYLADISVGQERKQLFTHITRDFSHIDTLINNAGYCQGGVLETMEEKDWTEQLQTNVIGSLEITRLALPLLRGSIQAKVIQMGSVSGRLGLPGLSLYAASKFALRGASQSLRFELQPQNIYVSLLEISAYKTNIWEKSTSSAKLSKENRYSSMQNMLIQHAGMNATSSADPGEVVNKIEKIITMPAPPFLILIGKTAKLLRLAEGLLPFALLERLVQQSMRKKEK